MKIENTSQSFYCNHLLKMAPLCFQPLRPPSLQLFTKSVEVFVDTVDFFWRWVFFLHLWLHGASVCFLLQAVHSHQSQCGGKSFITATKKISQMGKKVNLVEREESPTSSLGLFFFAFSLMLPVVRHQPLKCL